MIFLPNVTPVVISKVEIGFEHTLTFQDLIRKHPIS
jgi:hypothetical protein